MHDGVLPEFVLCEQGGHLMSGSLARCQSAQYTHCLVLSVETAYASSSHAANGRSTSEQRGLPAACPFPAVCIRKDEISTFECSSSTLRDHTGLIFARRCFA